jgi:hypothetical protein
MPIGAGLQEAFRSPFHYSNPSSRFCDLDSYTKGRSNPNVVNDYNYDYRLKTRMPDYNPYPNLHPITESRLPKYQEFDDPHQGAGWKYLKDPSYLRDNGGKCGDDHGPSSDDRAIDDRSVDTNEHACNALIQKVLTNKYCRTLLRKIFMEEPNTIEGFTGNLESKTTQNIIIYCLGGLIVLIIIDLLFRLGQIIKK